MRATTEKPIEDRLKDQIERRGGWCLKLWPGFFAGLPDRMSLLPGGILDFVETKAPKGTRSKRQIWVHDQLRRLGFRVHTVHNSDQLQTFLNHIDGLRQ